MRIENLDTIIDNGFNKFHTLGNLIFERVRPS